MNANMDPRMVLALQAVEEAFREGREEARKNCREPLTLNDLKPNLVFSCDTPRNLDDYLDGDDKD